ncbi:MAG: hypothetical protein SV375_21395 [Thermodesulfobacteriota bacterium]|nr:hypothetical protein [Thermodesulfobacteriota bacterium]
MRFLSVVAILVVFFYNFASAQSPPFSTVTITGEASKKFNKVCLFESGGSKEPLKTEYISEYGGKYSIDVDIPNDMREKDNYLYTDMRFWGDKNDNGIRDKGEPISECHFIIWVPSARIVYMQIYRGSKHLFKSSVLDYNYDR